MQGIILENMNQIREFCVQNHVKSLFAFGSVCTDTFNEQSDIDLIVEIDCKDPLIYGDKYFNLKFSLQDLFNRPVDLLENKAIKNPLFRQTIDNSKLLIYAA